MSSHTDTRRTMDVVEIESILPHRYPFLLVDRILDIEPGVNAVGLKAITMNEEFFKGHFPGHPVMPGVLITEAMAQVAGVLLLAVTGNSGKLAYFTGIDKQRFRKTIGPGDLLVTRVELIASRGHVGKIRAEGYVFRLETSSLTGAVAGVSRGAMPRNHVVCVVEEDGEKNRKLLLGSMEGELAAEGELMFALVDRTANTSAAD